RLRDEAASVSTGGILIIEISRGEMVGQPRRSQRTSIARVICVTSLSANDYPWPKVMGNRPFADADARLQAVFVCEAEVNGTVEMADGSFTTKRHCPLGELSNNPVRGNSAGQKTQELIERHQQARRFAQRDTP
ncbi:MAG TPA: hypothetical protein VL361_24005, partial [Candidatus Limnocylindrales bacterium]|nr:hypothetical protein [Candidatus Limnocylindrales bacterium]